MGQLLKGRCSGALAPGPPCPAASQPSKLASSPPCLRALLAFEELQAASDAGCVAGLGPPAVAQRDLDHGPLSLARSDCQQERWPSVEAFGAVNDVSSAEEINVCSRGDGRTSLAAVQPELLRARRTPLTLLNHKTPLEPTTMAPDENLRRRRNQLNIKEVDASNKDVDGLEGFDQQQTAAGCLQRRRTLLQS